ncbi:hypothetical protein SSBG_05951 [Streptomyces sp. SPB074]|nr:hypothetical protein SSBG_05951 [Streptomyces sp. SPB074]
MLPREPDAWVLDAEPDAVVLCAVEGEPGAGSRPSARNDTPERPSTSQSLSVFSVATDRVMGRRDVEVRNGQGSRAVE